MEQSSLMDTEICTQSSSKEDSVGVTGIPIKKDLGTVSLKSVVVLKDSDVTIRNGVVLMPNTIEMAQIKKQEKGQFKTQMCISSSMTEGDIKQVLVEAFPFLEGQRFYCAAAVDNRTRLDFHGIPRIWDGLYIKRKIKGNSALYILTHESTVTLKRSYDEIITPEESEKPEQPLKKETELANDQRHSACSNRCAPESDSMEQSSSSLFPIPKVSNHSLTVGQGVATLHPSNGSTVLKKCENLRPTEGPFLLQKLPDNLAPMMGCFFVPISAQPKGCVMSTAAASSNESAHQQKFMVTGGTVLQGAGLQKASVKQSSGRESSDNITDTERSELPIALQRVPHGVASSGLTPPMHNLNISGASSLQLCKDVHFEKMTQKGYQSAQTCKDGKEASRFLQETQTTAAEASSKCSTVTILKEESFSHVSTCQLAEKSISNDKSSHSDSGMETSDQNKEFSAIDMLCDVACSALKARITHKSSENKSKQLAMEDKSIIADICPMEGPLSGGNPFYISLKECLPEDVSSGFAVFRAVGTVELIKLDNFKFFGLKIPAASSPGRVDVKVQTSDGQYLGSTVFTYVDEDQEVLRRFITSNRLQSKFFSFLAQELAVRESKTEQDGTSKCSNPEKHGTDILHHSGQCDLRQMGGLAIVDDLGTSSGCSFPVEESGGRDTAGSTREASESLGSHNNTESSSNMGNKDEACKDQNSAFDQSSVRAEEISALKGVVDEILPLSGSVEGEYGFCILLSEPLPDNVSSGMAEFQGVETAGLFKSNSFNLSGFVPAASSPGIVPVKVQTSDGQYLGSTVFTYFDKDQEVFRRFITSNRLQSKFFSFLAEGLAIRESETEQGGTSKRSNPEKHGMDTSYLSPSRQSGFTQMLDCLAIDDRDSSVGSYPVEESGELKKAGNRTSSHEKTEINKYESCTSENSPSGQSRREQYARERDKSMLPVAKDCK